MKDLEMIFVRQPPPDFILQEEVWWRVIQRGQYHFWTSLVAQLVQNLPSMQETQVRSLGQEHPLEKGMATHTSNLAWRISWTEDPGGFQSMGSQRVGHDWVTNTHNIVSVFLPVNSKSSEQIQLEIIDMANLVWWPPRHDDIYGSFRIVMLECRLEHCWEK